MTKLIKELDIHMLHRTGAPFDPEQVRQDFRLYSHKKRAETLDIVRARLDTDEVSSIRTYASAARLYDDLRAEHDRLNKNGL